VPSRTPAWGEQTSPGKMRERTRVLICCMVSQGPAQAAYRLCGQAAACSLEPRPRPLLQPGWFILTLPVSGSLSLLSVYMCNRYTEESAGRHSSAVDAARASASLNPRQVSLEGASTVCALLRQALAPLAALAQSPGTPAPSGVPAPSGAMGPYPSPPGAGSQCGSPSGNYSTNNSNNNNNNNNNNGGDSGGNPLQCAYKLRRALARVPVWALPTPSRAPLVTG